MILVMFNRLIRKFQVVQPGLSEIKLKFEKKMNARERLKVV